MTDEFSRLHERSRFSAWTFVAPVVLLVAFTIVVSIVRGSGWLDPGTTSTPSASTTTAKTTTPTGTGAGTTTTKPGQTGGLRQTYEIASGDTLSTIAERFRTDVDALVRLNPGITPSALVPGERIRIK
jgi:LysM repeat protein